MNSENLKDKLINTIAILESRKLAKQSYIDMYLPLVIYALNELTNVECVDIKKIHDIIKKDTTFELHVAVIGRILEHCLKNKYITRQSGTGFYVVTPSLPKSTIEHAKINKFKINIEFICKELIRISKKYNIEFTDDVNDALDHIEKFSNSYSEELLLFFRGNLDLNLDDNNKYYNVFLLINELKSKNPMHLDAFMQVVECMLLKNVLLHEVPLVDIMSPSFKLKMFFLDTRIVLALLHFDGTDSYEYYSNLINIIKKTGARLYILERTKMEIVNLLSESISNFNNIYYLKNRIISSCIEMGYSVSFLERSMNNIDEKISKLGVSITNYPFNETIYKKYGDDLYDKLKKDNSKYNEEALEHDVMCVNDLLSLWRGRSFHKLETIPSIFLTTNLPLYKATKHVLKMKYPPVITANSLSIYFWLNSSQNFNMHKDELLAYTKIMLTPNQDLWESVIKSLNELKKDGNITKEQFSYLITTSILEEEIDSKIINHELFDYEEMKRLTLKLSQENEEKAVESEKKSAKINNMLNCGTIFIFCVFVILIFSAVFVITNLIFSTLTSASITLITFGISLCYNLYLHKLRKHSATLADRIKKGIYNRLDKFFTTN